MISLGSMTGYAEKASEVERQLRDKELVACCEEQMENLARQTKGGGSVGGSGGRSQRRGQGRNGREGQVGQMWKTSCTAMKERFAETREVASKWKHRQETKRDS